MLAHKDTGYPVAFVISMLLKEMLTHGISTLAMRDDAPVPWYPDTCVYIYTTPEKRYT